VDPNKVRQHSQQAENNSKPYISQAKEVWFPEGSAVGGRENARQGLWTGCIFTYGIDRVPFGVGDDATAESPTCSTLMRMLNY